VRRTVAAGVAAAGIAVAASACSPQPSGPTPGQLLALRMCESGGNYGINTGNGFYGAYQFAAGTWSSLGFGGLPSEAPPWVQDQAVVMLWQRSGWSPWPGCSASLGLR
jgi:hypothetical protein